MVDLWSEHEFCLMQAPLAERKEEEEQLRNDFKTYTVDDKGYSWRQTQEDMEITFCGHPLTSAEAKAARIVIQRTRLKVELKGQAVFDDELWEAVRSDESTWTVGDGLLTVQLAKVPLDPPERNNWPRCGRSEPHKYEKEYKARQERKEARRREEEERLLQEALAEVAAQAPSEAEEADSAVAQPEAPRECEQTRGADSELGRKLQQRLVRQGELVGVAGAAGAPAAGAPAAAPAAAARGSSAEAGCRGTIAEAAPEAQDASETAEAEEAAEPVASIASEAAPAGESAPSQAQTRPSRRRSGATTGTAAERQRIMRELALKEEKKWKQGTSEESWLRDRSKALGSLGLGPLPAAEVWRRDGRPEEGA